MARKVRDEYCIICSETPCKCNKKSTRKSTVSAKRTCDPPEKSVGLANRAGLSSIKKASRPVKSARRPSLPTKNEDKDLQRAVTILFQAGLVSPESASEHRALITLTDTEIRAIQWKQRRDYQQRRESESGRKEA